MDQIRDRSAHYRNANSTRLSPFNTSDASNGLPAFDINPLSFPVLPSLHNVAISACRSSRPAIVRHTVNRQPLVYAEQP
jgi:hypothetical protein